MSFNIAQYGAGLGLVMVGWVCGMCVSYVLNTNAILSTLGRK